MLNRKSRRFGVAPVGHDLDRRTNAVVGAAAADVGDGRVNLGISRFRFFFEQRDGGHDHAALAKPALRHVQRRPGFLHRVRAVGRQAFNGHDFLSRSDRRQRSHTGARRHAIDVHGAGTTGRDAAAVFGAGQPQLFSQHPQEGRVGLGLEAAHSAVHVQLRHRLIPFCVIPLSIREIIQSMMLRRLSKFCTVFAFLAIGLIAPGCAQQPPPAASVNVSAVATEADLQKQIRAEVGDAKCAADQQCKTLAVGQKDCGGPEYWLAWSSQQSKAEALQARSAELAVLQRQRNEASGARSNCRYIPDPGAMCIASRCVLKTPNNAN